MEFTRTLTALALVMGLGSSPLLAQEESSLDADQDETITEEEWTNYGDESFGQADADQSGGVDQEEYDTWAENEGIEDENGGLFDDMDADDNDEVSEDEWFSEERFAEYDEDQSGSVEDDEWF